MRQVWSYNDWSGRMMDCVPSHTKRWSPKKNSSGSKDLGAEKQLIQFRFISHRRKKVNLLGVHFCSISLWGYRGGYSNCTFPALYDWYTTLVFQSVLVLSFFEYINCVECTNFTAIRNTDFPVYDSHRDKDMHRGVDDLFLIHHRW